MVGRWVIASKGWDFKLNQDSKRIGSGQKAFYPEAEEKLYTWLIEQRKQGLAVTYTILRIKMQNILKEREMTTLYGDSAKEFKTSCQWISSFMKSFLQSVSLRGKQLSKGEKIPPGVVVWFQDKGWMDSELMNRYIDYLGDETNKRTGAGAPKLMVYDSFRGHLKKLVKRSWDGISDEIIIDSFKTCGISNALDDVEDFDNEIIDISDDDLEDGINDDLENDGNDDNLEDDISWDDLDIGINEYLK
ncbi:hypothetical protein RclHR1_00320008 [Rhizophagus clarus]|uniref:HTH CENPB-type domain-containing protein n=1 Tax=Rhizophagus clarus TaxID=94130 RepID=A0A2Z6R7W5_9GLOM|nr:hypothetical protein RclHR1_00320008 [Rhizophagus clarus]